MASFELISAVQDYEKYISNNGINEQVIELYCDAAKVSIETEKDIEYGLSLTKRAKEIIETLVLNMTGSDIWTLEKYAQDNNQEYNLLNKYYEVLKLESYEKLESFIFYMEIGTGAKDSILQEERR